MGQGFSVTTLSAGSAGIDVPELADLVYEKSMGSARFMKSIRARHNSGLALVKVIVKPYRPMDLSVYAAQIIKERKALAQVPNALSYERIIETETNGYLVRQYLYSSLYDRMSTRPFLEDVEKKWLAFQLLCALRDCHARDVFHGDIKTENVLVTSWNWLYLADFSSFKPTTLPEDNPADFSYFFDTAGRRTCYVAPERFIPSGEVPDPSARVTWAMDVFSAGCVIAELFLEAPIFNLSQLFKYKSGEYDPVALHLDRIQDKDVREMVMHMIHIDPEKRYSADDYLNVWRKTVFPDYFYSFLHQYMDLITDPSSGRSAISGATVNLGEADERIDRIYYDFDKIAYFLGYQDSDGTPHPPSHKSSLDLFPIQLNIPNHDHPVRPVKQGKTDDGTLIFSTLVASSLRSTARAAARVRGCDVLLALSERLTDEAKLDRVLPYLVALLHDEADIVKIAALRTITQLMALVDVVTPVNARVFPEYILPRMQGFIGESTSRSSSSPIVRATYAACIGRLASSASRFLDMMATLRADGTLPTSDPETEGDETDATFYGLFDNARVELVEIFESHTKALITDSDSSVRRSFLSSVPELCMFFGTAASNDIILSHLNTYLNDRDWILKCAFFETIVGIATFLGGTSVEEFILPLMVQALTDPEDFVVERVLRSLASLAELGLFQRAKTWELVDIVARFTIHPNIWIREAAAMFISCSTTYLSQADRQCIVLPLLRPYLKTIITDFSELSILDALKKPLPRPVVDLAMTWAFKVDKGIFWKPVHKLRTFSFDTGHSLPLLSRDLVTLSLSKTPRNDEDEQWLTRLRNIGMGHDDEWKLLALREYIWRTAPLRAREVASPPAYLNGIINVRRLGITPQTVLFDDKQMSEETIRKMKTTATAEGGAPHTIADALLDASMTIDDSLSRKRKIGTNRQRLGEMFPSSIVSQDASPLESPPAHSVQSSPRGSIAPIDVERTRLTQRVGKRDDDELSAAGSSINSRTAIRHRSSAMNLLNRRESSKSSPETGMTSANAFGKLEGPFSQAVAKSPISMAKEKMENLQPEFRFRAAHTYSGNDPSILKMLDSMYIENYPNDMIEFGPTVNPLTRRRTMNRAGSQPNDKPWRPMGILVATFAEHIGPVHRVVVAADHVFFITGGNDGSVKIWDTARLERNIAHRSRQTHRHAAGARVTALCFVANTHCFVSCASDGSVHVVRVDYVFSGGVTRYGKLRVLRQYQLPPGEYAVWSDHFRYETNSVLVIATNLSRVLAIDLRNMNMLYMLENPVHHGTPTCFVIDQKRNWLLLGTSHGVLDLWDLRFKLRLKAWGVPGSTSIHRIALHPFRGRGRWVCVAGGSGPGEITVWDVEKTQCREVYRTGTSNKDSPKSYEPWPVDEDKPEGMLGRFATALDAGTANTDRGVRALVIGTDGTEDGRDSRSGFMITGGSDRKIRFWDMARIESSCVVSGLDVDEAKPSFAAEHPPTALTINTERIPRPGPTAPNAAAGSRAGKNGKPPRSTVISLQQQMLLKSHLDSILDVALLESPYGMTVSVDRSGVTYVFQ